MPRIPALRMPVLGSSEAVADCMAATPIAAGYGNITRVIRAETNRAGAVADWQELRHAPAITGIVSPLRAEEASAQVTVCLYLGSFATPVGPPKADGSARPSHDVLRLLVLDDGRWLLDSAGYQGRMTPETPTDWSLSLAHP